MYVCMYVCICIYLCVYIYVCNVVFIAEQDKAIAFCHQKLSALGVTGRLRIGREVQTLSIMVSYYPPYFL